MAHEIQKILAAMEKTTSTSIQPHKLSSNSLNQIDGRLGIEMFQIVPPEVQIVEAIDVAVSINIKCIVVETVS